MSTGGWLLLILVLLILAILIWQWWRRRSTTAAAPEAQPLKTSVETPVMTAAPLAAAPVMRPAAMASDDLEIIEGIGPKVAGILKAEGIISHTQLAATDVDRLKTILKAHNFGYLDPSTWPEQSKLAAAGRMDDLQKLQDGLKGGRRA